MTEIIETNSEVTVISTPDSLIERAIDQGASVETISSLLELRKEYEAQEAEKAFNEAFSKWQTLKPVLVKTKKVSYPHKTGGGKTEYKYCPLDQIEAQIQIPLRECGLSYKWQGIVHSDGRDGQSALLNTHWATAKQMTSMPQPTNQAIKTPYKPLLHGTAICRDIP